MPKLVKSYVHGIGPLSLIGMTVGAVLDEAARNWPDQEALIVPHQKVRWTWAQLQTRAKTLAAGLLRAGLQPGDRLGILATNRCEWVVVQFATAYAGIILVNINPGYRAQELAFAINRAGCRALVTEASYKTSDYIAMMREIAPELDRCEAGMLVSAKLPDLQKVISLGDENLRGFLKYTELATGAHGEEATALEQISATLNFDDPINIQFTSGTTGTPKAATLTHHNIVNNARLSAAIMNFTEADRLCIPVPMYHCFGMVLGSLLCATYGAAMIFPSAGFDAAAVLDTVEKERCTALHGVPTMFISILDEPDFAERDLSSLRTGIMAGAPCPVELMHRVIEDMHIPEITIAYGMTETGPLSTQTKVDDPIELRVGTVGCVLPHTEVKVVDPDSHITPVGISGELYTRGYCVMRGYWADPEKTAKEIDAAHWIKSGDIATMDEDGYVRIVGRLKDIVIRGGENIFPREIEEFLYSNSKIDEVEVFGVPDVKFGEEVAAWIKLREGETATENEIREFCKGKLAHFKIPKYIRFVQSFPMTVTGKVQKFVMRDEMAKALGLSQEKRI